MPQKITDTAQLSCDQGSSPSNLSVTCQTFSTIEKKAIATEQDKQPNSNIKPFGQCKITNSSCNPSPNSWQKTTEKDTINNHKILTEDSSCQCGVGGKISISNKGHGEKHNVES